MLRDEMVSRQGIIEHVNIMQKLCHMMRTVGVLFTEDAVDRQRKPVRTFIPHMLEPSPTCTMASSTAKGGRTAEWTKKLTSTGVMLQQILCKSILEHAESVMKKKADPQQLEVCVKHS